MQGKTDYPFGGNIQYDKTAWQKVMPFYHIRALVCVVLSIKRDRLNANPPLQQYDSFRQPQ